MLNFFPPLYIILGYRVKVCVGLRVFVKRDLTRREEKTIICKIYVYTWSERERTHVADTFQCTSSYSTSYIHTIRRMTLILHLHYPVRYSRSSILEINMFQKTNFSKTRQEVSLNLTLEIYTRFNIGEEKSAKLYRVVSSLENELLSRNQLALDNLHEFALLIFLFYR